MLDHLYAALHSPRGIIIQTEDAEKLRQRYYAIRRETLDPDLDRLSFIISPTDPSQLWIVRNDQKKGTPPAGVGDA